jgi:hypothetical protein
MANQDPNQKTTYWYEGNSSSIIKAKANVTIGYQNYWYNGKPQGFLTIKQIGTVKSKPRAFAVLVGF